MISRAQIQFIRSLDQKKYRDESSCFIVEGDKMVRETIEMPALSPFEIRMICAVGVWLDSNPGVKRLPDTEIIEVSASELDRISQLKTPNQALAVIRHRQISGMPFDFEHNLLIGLDQVQDPGNVGTIIRLADWFGLGGVIASADSADFFSPKVVQASMGSVLRVKLVTADLPSFIQSLPSGFPVYGTHLGGKNIYSTSLESHGFILFGNESKGLSGELMKLTTENLFIPDFSVGAYKPDSLNVSIATAIVCSEFRRRENG
jgi:TrmH family RNA methyltransferase